MKRTPPAIDLTKVESAVKRLTESGAFNDNRANRATSSKVKVAEDAARRKPLRTFGWKCAGWGHRNFLQNS